MSDGALLRDYQIQLEVFKCSPQSQEVGCLVELGQDIREVMPYLNAVLRRCRYNPDAPALEISHQGRGYALWARRIAFGGVTCFDEAEQAMQSVQRLINETWQRRHEITPSDRKGPTLSPLELFQLLPGVNCGACGEPTCLAFAAKVARETMTIGQCSSLSRADNAGRRKKLAALLTEAGYEVPEGWA
ncbi:MAG: (Fe-S)-binding protein [Armatimonadota bacterium]